MEEERGANKWSDRTNNQDTILNILEITQSFRRARWVGMINDVKCWEGQNKAFIYGEKVIISNYL